jgi:DNA-binding MarR family transcriptional regulator
MLNLSLRQLRSLLAVEKSGKISIAANSLGLTGPAVTLQLKQAEEKSACRCSTARRRDASDCRRPCAVLDAAHAVQERLRLLERN